MTERIFFIFHGRYPSEKAAALFAAESVAALKAEGREVIVLAPRRLGRGKGEAVYLPTLDLFSILPHALAFRLSYFVFAVSAYAYLLLRARQDDVVYSNEALPLFLAASSFPNTFYELHDYPGRGRLFYHALLRRVRGVVVTNRSKATRLASDFPECVSKVLVEPNAVALAEFSVGISKEEARAKLNLPTDAKIVVYTGHLYGWKGVDTLAEAARATDAQVYVVGGTEADITRYTKQWGSIENLHIVGLRPHQEMPLWQKAANVLVVPNSGRESISTHDTSPMKLFEYMASGTPIVASRLPSIEEIVSDESAYLVEPDNPEALAKGIEEALRAPEASARAAAARRAVEEHSWEKRAKRILAWLPTLPLTNESYRHERTIFWASCAATSLFILIFVASGNASAPLATVDSDGYLPLATALYENGLWSDTTTHTPGYPLFLAITAVPWGSVLPTLIIQALLLAYSAVLLYRLFEGVFSPRVRFWGALAFGIEPFTVFITAQPLSEALFLFLTIGGLYLLRRAYEQGSLGLMFWSGAVLGASALVRPIILYLLPLLALVLAVGSKRFKALALVAGVLIVLAPWSYRNFDTFGTWALSNKGPFTLYFYEASELLQYREHISHEEANQLLLERAQVRYPEVRTQDDMSDPSYGSFLTQEALAIIGESPLLFAKIHALALGTFFLSDGYRLLWYELSNGAITLPNITYAIARGDVAALANYFKSEPAQAAAFAFGFAFWSLALLLAVIGFLRGVTWGPQRVRLTALALAVVIVYFALMTGLESQARYRIPVTPALFMLAAYGASALLAKRYVD